MTRYRGRGYRCSSTCARSHVIHGACSRASSSARSFFRCITVLRHFALRARLRFLFLRFLFPGDFALAFFERVIGLGHDQSVWVGRNEKARRSGLPRKLVKEAYAACTWSACMPFGPFTLMKVTFWPSCNDLKPSPWMARKWTNRSSPLSGLMKPKPLASLNHLTVPLCLSDITYNLWKRG